MVGHDQAGFTEQKVERKILKTMESISACENRKSPVSHDCNIPNISDSGPGILRIDRHRLGIHYRKKTVVLENFRARRREYSLRKDHDGIVLYARPRFMISHSGLS